MPTCCSSTHMPTNGCLCQHMLMRVAVGIHMHDIAKAIETYNLMSQKYFTHARCLAFCVQRARVLLPGEEEALFVAPSRVELTGISLFVCVYSHADACRHLNLIQRLFTSHPASSSLNKKKQPHALQCGHPYPTDVIMLPGAHEGGLDRGHLRHAQDVRPDLKVRRRHWCGVGSPCLDLACLVAFLNLRHGTPLDFFFPRCLD